MTRPSAGRIARAAEEDVRSLQERIKDVISRRRGKLSLRPLRTLADATVGAVPGTERVERMGVLLIKAGEAKKLDLKAVSDERQLQKYIVENPECLPTDEIEEGLRLVVVAREFASGSGPIDALGLDEDGAVYVIETKLYRNADKRRVVAQVLDYGAGLWSGYRGRAEFAASLEENARQQFGKSAREEIERAFALKPEEATRLLERAAENIKAGRLRFVVLMDHIDEDLKNLIAFVNENSEFTVYGVELEFYELEGGTLVVPRLYGAEPQKSAGGTPVTIRDEAFFSQAREMVSPEVQGAIRAVYEFSAAAADRVGWGRGATGSFSPRFYAVSPRSMFTVYADGRLYMNFPYLGFTEPGKAAREMLGSRLEGMGLPLPQDFRDRFVRLDPERWAPKHEQLLELFREAVATAREPEPKS